MNWAKIFAIKLCHVSSIYIIQYSWYWCFGSSTSFLYRNILRFNFYIYLNLYFIRNTEYLKILWKQICTGDNNIQTVLVNHNNFQRKKKRNSLYIAVETWIISLLHSYIVIYTVQWYCKFMAGVWIFLLP